MCLQFFSDFGFFFSFLSEIAETIETDALSTEITETNLSFNLHLKLKIKIRSAMKKTPREGSHDFYAT